jgi:Spy/CpxP family protein refolding chaperone
MKRLILPAALVFALAGTAAFAQQPDTNQPPPPMHHHRKPSPEQETRHLTKALNLTPDQAARLEPILANRDQQMQAIHANGQLTQQDARQQMKALHQSTEQQLAGVLTPDQLQQMKSMHHDPHGHGPRDPNQPPPPPPSGN